MPQSPLSHPLPQAALPVPPLPVRQRLPEPQRQQCHALMAQWRTALGHGAQSAEPSPEGADASDPSAPPR
jgi:hypothetical protein